MATPKNNKFEEPVKRRMRDRPNFILEKGELPEGMEVGGLWELTRAAVEGGKMSMQQAAKLMNVEYKEVKGRSMVEAWETPMAIKKANEQILEKVMEKAFGFDLREHIETPKKFQVKDHELLPMDSFQGRMDLIDLMKGDLKEKLAGRKDSHLMMVSEVARVAFEDFLIRMQTDPSLAMHFAKNLEVLDKMAQRAYEAEDRKKKDALGGVRGVLVMSDPTFIPRGAILDAEIIEPESASDSSSDESPDFESPEQQTVEIEEYE